MLNIKPQNLFLVVFNLRYFNLPGFKQRILVYLQEVKLPMCMTPFGFFIEVLTEIREHLN